MSSNKKQIGLYWKRLTVTVSLAATTGIFLATASAPVHAQQEAGMLLEEIVVTARRREESLTDVPVAISVVSGDYIEEQGLLDQYDLVAELPSVQYDQTRDRLGARPSIRGVSTTSQDALFQTASVFLDGMPLLGNSGNLKYAGVERVEVLRGPQSTAFGRATFAGAINYVSKDPGDTFESKFDLHTSDLGRNLVGVSLSGPISDTLGFTLNANFDEFEGPDEWVTSEGLPVGGESTDFVTGKLKFAPNDFFDMEVRMSYLRTDDQLTTEGFISGAEQARCSNFTLPSGDLYFQGDFNCDISTSFPSGGQPRNRQPELDFTPGTREFYAVQTYSVLDPRVFTERDRITAEFNFNLDNGSAIQILSSYNDEFLRRWDERDRSDAMASVSFNAAGIPRVRGVSSRANPKGGPEQYLDVRWDSAPDGAVRWNVGASMFDYRYKLQVHSQFAGVLLGLEDEGNAGRPFLPGTQNDQASTAIGVYGGLQWDVSDRTTLSFEGRFQQDSITNTDFLSGLSFENVTESFQPRLALTQTLTEDWTLYSQFSSGTNPAGVNTVFASPNVAGSIAAAKAAGYITYDDSTFRAFEEEKLTNFEVGLKGGALDNRLQLTAAVYVMKWEDRLQRANLDWTGSDPDPATGLCADPQCWNDGTNNRSQRHRLSRRGDHERWYRDSVRRRESLGRRARGFLFHERQLEPQGLHCPEQHRVRWLLCSVAGQYLPLHAHGHHRGRCPVRLRRCQRQSDPAGIRRDRSAECDLPRAAGWRQLGVGRPWRCSLRRPAGQGRDEYPVVSSRHDVSGLDQLQQRELGHYIVWQQPG